MKTGTFYGFRCCSHSEEPAWFYNRQSAVNWAAACGFDKDCVIETATEAPIEDILDTPERLWTKELIKDYVAESLPVELCDTIAHDMDTVDMTTRDMVTIWQLGVQVWLHSRRLGAEYPKE